MTSRVEMADPPIGADQDGITPLVSAPSGSGPAGRSIRRRSRGVLTRAVAQVATSVGHAANLAPGERRALNFEIGPERLSYHGPDLKRVVEPGRFRAMVGGSSAEVKSAGLDVAGP